MPALSPTMTQGNIAEWKVEAGAKVSAGDVIADIETDKATMALESMEDGFVAKIVVPAGASDVQVGEVVAVMVEEESDVAKFADYVPAPASASAADTGPPSAAGAGPGPGPPPPARPPRVVSRPAAPRPPPARVFASPKARAMAEAAGISVAQVVGTGPGGRVVMADVGARRARASRPSRRRALRRPTPPLASPGSSPLSTTSA